MPRQFSNSVVEHDGLMVKDCSQQKSYRMFREERGKGNSDSVAFGCKLPIKFVLRFMSYIYGELFPRKSTKCVGMSL